MSAVKVKHDRLRPNGWPEGFGLRMVLLSDIHACTPWMTPRRIARIVAQVNALKPDVILLLGDYMTALKGLAGIVPHDDWANELAKLNAPLGVHAVLGNHDWQEDPEATARMAGPTIAGSALEARGIAVYENRAAELEKDGQRFWVAGLGSQRAKRFRHRDRPDTFEGVDDLDGTLAQVTNDAPVILMAHEPDIFPDVPDRVSLTLSGHTHGGQVRLFNRAYVVPSVYGERYVYGHIREDGRDLIVSGGVGYSLLPIRFGMPAQFNLIELG